MIGYPNKKKGSSSQVTINNAARRGMSLEEDINASNDYYRVNNLAVIYKKPTPIQIVDVYYPSRNKAKIVEAYFRQPSTTDYNGVFSGFYIDFEAKETQNKTTFPLALIHKHQLDHLRSVHLQGAVSFVIIRFTRYNETYLIYSETLFEWLAQETTRSIKLTWIREHGRLIQSTYHAPCDYLAIIKRDYFEVKK